MSMSIYQSPLVGRSASPEMAHIWSDEYKFNLWRELWCNLARAQSQLGLSITNKQLNELESALKDADMGRAEEYEKELHHDVMAHIKAFGDQAPSARGIIHLGATSQFVVDNADSMRIKTSLSLIITKLKSLIVNIGEFANNHKSVATLGLTHFQPAQPTTVGKRASLWAYDLYLVLSEINHKYLNLKARGVKGATGTQASYLELFDGNHDKVKSLDTLICNMMGFGQNKYAVTGQVYPRIDDSILVCLMSSLAAVCQKIATDIRLLAGKKELAEGFGAKQVGSSAMPYKKNPLYCERVCGIAKFAIGLSTTALITASEQWLERSLDDSSARRLVLPEIFLSVDGILNTMIKIFGGLVVNHTAIADNLNTEIALMTVEKILMAAVKRGADRQELHEKLRQCSLNYSGDELIKELSAMKELKDIDISEYQNDILVGRAVEQVDEFFNDFIKPLKNQQMV